MEDFKIFEQLEKSKGYDIALMTTFNFNINFFERCILSKLYENDIKKVSVFCDSKELNKAMLEISHSSIGRKYIVNPIEMNGAFHPKLILLLGQNKAKLFVSSANLTVNGYYINNEIFNIFEYNENSSKDLKIINEAINFFIKLNELSYKQDQILFDEIKELLYFNKNTSNNQMYLLNNIDNSILEQIKDIVEEPKRIDIAVPYYDNDLGALDKIHTEFPNSKIVLYLQNKKCRFNKEKAKTREYIHDVKAFEGFLDRNTTTFYHGKVFRIVTESQSYILYGSANCTENALIKTLHDNGNIECSILEKGRIEEFDYFFDNFKLDMENELTCDLISYDIKSQNNFYFKYGILEAELKLFLGYTDKKEEIKILCNDKELEYSYQNDILEVYISLREVCEIDDVFRIQILFKDGKEEVKCWYINRECLELNRVTEAKDFLYRFNFDSDGDRYIEDRIAILKANSLDYYDIKKEIEINEFIKQSEKGDIEEEEDDGIVNYIIPTIENIEYYNRSQFVKKIKNTYVERYFKEFKDIEKKYTMRNSRVKSDFQEKVSRTPTTNEIKFRRFVKNRVNGMLKSQYVELVNSEHYLGSILVFNEIFDKYTFEENIEGLFEGEYIIEIKSKLLNNLLNMDFREFGEEIIENTKAICIQTIIENKCLSKELNENYKVRSWNKNILAKLDRVFYVRENYRKYVLGVIDKLNSYGYNINYENELKYINDLFGYKTDEELERLFIKEYGECVRMEEKEGKLVIKSSTYDITQYMKLNHSLVQEIINNYKNYNKPLNNIIIEIKNLKKDYATNSNPADILIYEINILQKNYVRRIKRQLGDEDIPEYHKLTNICI